MIVPKGVVVPLALLVMLATTTIGFAGGIGEAPRAFFGGSEVMVIGPPGGELPGRASVSVGLAGAIGDLPYVSVVSPEVFVFTTVQGRSSFARGVDFERFLAIEDGTLVAGRMPAAPGEALVGIGFARTFGVAPGERLVLPSSFVRVGMPVTIVGVMDAPTAARDEILLDLATARVLGNIDAGSAHVLRVETTAKHNVSALLASVAPTFSFTNVRISSASVLPVEPAYLLANLTNWGTVPAIKLVEVRRGGDVIAEEPYAIGARQSIPIAIPFHLDAVGATEITVNPTLPVAVREPSLRILGVPDRAVNGTTLALHVVTRAGVPAERVNVTLAGSSAWTDASGGATVNVTQPGRLHVLAIDENGVGGIAPIFVVEPERAKLALVQVTRIALPRDVIGTTAPARFFIEAENNGGAPGELMLDVRLDGATLATSTHPLRPGERIRVPIDVGPLDAGDHELALAGTSVVSTFTAYAGRDPRIEWLKDIHLKSHAGGIVAISPAEEDAQEYVDEIVGNVGLAVLALSLASGALAATGAIAVLARHIGERTRSIGTLKAVGADDAFVLAATTREAAMGAAIAAIVGIPAGIGLAFLIDALDVVRAFGHGVRPSFSWTTELIIAIVAIAFVAITARGIVGGHLAAAPDDLLRARTSSRTANAPPSLDDVVEGRA